MSTELNLFDMPGAPERPLDQILSPEDIMYVKDLKMHFPVTKGLLKRQVGSVKAVDTATDARIQEAFARTIPGTTKLIIAQRISSVQNADRILVLEDGTVSGFDTHEHLLKTNPIYQEIYNAQIKGGGDFDHPSSGDETGEGGMDR